VIQDINVDKSTLSATQIGEINERAVASWVYCWGYTSAALIQQILNKQASGWAALAVRRGLLRAMRTAAGTPREIYVLTERGLAVAERHANSLHPYEFLNPHRIAQPLIRHSLVGQQCTLAAIRGKRIQAYKTEIQTQDAGRPGEKRPDVTWITSDGERVGVEIELTSKWRNRFDDFVLRVSAAVSRKPDGSRSYDAFAVLTDSPALAKRYQGAFQDGRDLRAWTKGADGLWSSAVIGKVSEDVARRIDFVVIDS